MEDSGYDLTAWGSTSQYNTMIKEQNLKLVEIPDGKLVVVAGSSSAIWEKIKEFKEKSGSTNPVDDYAKKVSHQLKSQFSDHDIQIRLTKDMEPDNLVSFVRLI